MQLMKCVIVEDELLAQAVLQEYIGMFPELLLVGSAFSAPQALTLIREKEPDVLFLDINLPQISGFELLETLKNPNLRVVITSADESYALRGYDFDVVDFLKKPITLTRFMVSVERIHNRMGRDQAKLRSTNLSGLDLANGGKALRVVQRNQEIILPLETSTYIKADGDYVLVFTQQAYHLLSASLNECEDSLPSPPFYRVHRSYIVNIQHIEEIQNKHVKLISGESITITPKYRHNMEKNQIALP